RFNDRDLDAQRCYFAREHLGETFNTPFRSRIGPPPGRSNPSTDRGKLNEITCLPFPKVRESCLGHDDRAEEVRFDLCAEIRYRRVFDGREIAVTRVVDNYVQEPKRINCRPYRTGRPCFVSHV